MGLNNINTEKPGQTVEAIQADLAKAKRTQPWVALVLALGLWLPGGAQAGRLIATPYAETLSEGRYSVWQFGLRENRSTDNWRSLNRLDLGLTDRLELGIFVINPRNAPTDTWLNVQYRLTAESEQAPTLSVGLWDAADIEKLSGQTTGGSFFVAAGKTLKPAWGVAPPQYLKLSLGAGTNRLNGLFGGFDVRFTRSTGMFVEYVPTNLRMPGTDRIDVGVYHWLSPQWRTRVSWMGGNPMIDVFYTGVIGQ